MASAAEAEASSLALAADRYAVTGDLDRLERDLEVALTRPWRLLTPPPPPPVYKPRTVERQ